MTRWPGVQCCEGRGGTTRMFSWQWCLKMKLPQARWMVFIMENPWKIHGWSGGTPMTLWKAPCIFQKAPAYFMEAIFKAVSAGVPMLGAKALRCVGRGSLLVAYSLCNQQTWGTMPFQCHSVGRGSTLNLWRCSWFWWAKHDFPNPWDGTFWDNPGKCHPSTMSFLWRGTLLAGTLLQHSFLLILVPNTSISLQIIPCHSK